MGLQRTKGRRKVRPHPQGVRQGPGRRQGILLLTAIMTTASSALATMPQPPLSRVYVPGKAGSAQAQYGAMQTNLAGMPGIRTEQGMVDPATLGTAMQIMTGQMIQQVEQAAKDPASRQQAVAAIEAMNQHVQQEIAAGHVKAFNLDQLSAMGAAVPGSEVLGMSGQSAMTGQGFIEDIIGQVLNLIPGFGPFFAQAAKAIQQAIDDIQTIRSIMAVIQNSVGIIKQLTSLEGIGQLIGILGPQGGQLLQKKFGSTLTMDPNAFPTFSGIPGLQDINKYAQMLQSANWNTILGQFGVTRTATLDPFKAKTGVSKYISPTAVTTALNQTYTEIDAIDKENASVDNTAAAAEAQASTEKLSKESIQTVRENQVNEQIYAAGATTLGEEGLARENLMATAHANVLIANSSAVNAAGAAATVKAVSAMHQDMKTLVADTIAKNRADAVEHNMMQEYVRGRAEQNASTNALLSSFIPAFATATSMDGEYDLDLPQPDKDYERKGKGTPPVE